MTYVSGRTQIAGIAALMAVAAALVPLGAGTARAAGDATTTPIHHLVVIVGVGVSFDHYFGTYPNAANTDGTKFDAAASTPSVNGLTAALLTSNPNLFNPQRLTPSEALTCSQNPGYAALERAMDLGKMDEFEQNTAVDTCTGQPILFGAPGLVMDYYDHVSQDRRGVSMPMARAGRPRLRFYCVHAP